MLNTPSFHGSYCADDVQFLLKPIQMENTDVTEKERLIQSGKRHYSEMIVQEYQPSDSYMQVFHHAFTQNSQTLADNVLTLAHHLQQKKEVVLVSLARAGTPVGVLLKHTLRDFYQRDVPHYSISIIRDRGIDANALKYILNHHDHLGRDIVFIDGWTGKGVIGDELQKWISLFNQENKTEISSDLYVLADLSGTAAVSATLEDYLIPSSLLNSTINGLISRSILNDDYIGAEDFHGCCFYDELHNVDLSRWYVKEIMQQVHHLAKSPVRRHCTTIEARAERKEISHTFVKEMMDYYGIGHVNYLKPGLGEAIRVLLRRAPERILVQDKQLEAIQPFLVLAEEKNVPIEEIPSMPYKAAGIIQHSKQKI